MEQKQKLIVRLNEEELRKFVALDGRWRLESGRYDVEKRELYLEWLQDWEKGEPK